MTATELRPLERTVVKLERRGMPVEEIAWRLRRSPGHISRVLAWTRLPRPDQREATPQNLRPLERRVLHARSAGIDRSETAARLRRSPQHVARIERYADYKLAELA